MEFSNKKLLIQILEKYHIKEDILNLIFKNSNNNYSKFKNLTYEILDITKYLNSLVISNNINLSQNNIILTIFKIIRNGKDLNYGFVYGHLINNIIENKYIILSLSSISKDGEYKHRFINFNQIEILLKNPILEIIYNFLYNNYKNKYFDLSFLVYNLSNSKILNKYKSKLSNKIILIKCYCIIWLVELYVKNNNNYSMSDNFYDILFSNYDINYFDEIYKKHKNEINNLIPSLVSYNVDLKLEIGQKILPFNYIQLKEYNHLIHFQWKELLINRIINNLIHQNISICFPLFIDWIFIKKSDKKLFNNDEIFKKIHYSDQLKIILKSLLLTKNNLIKLNNFNEKNKILSKLETKIQIIINEAKVSILMSNISLCFFSEYSGRTLFNRLNLLTKNIIHPNIGDLFNNYKLLKKYIFDIIYSLYALNLKGIIHGDLHLNNITLNIISDLKDNNYVLYDLNNDFNIDIINYINKYPDINNVSNTDIYITTNNSSLSSSTPITPKYLNNCYQFQHYGCFPSIIDYSRSFILLKLIDTNIIENNNKIIRAKFIKNETKRIINELNKIFPNYIKNNVHKLKFLFKNKNFYILFIYFSAYDTFTFITNLLIYMKKVTLNNNIKVNSKILELLTAISKKSYYYLEQLLNEENYNEKKLHQFPNYSLLTEFFSENKSKNLDINVTHYFNLNNINRYQTPLDIKKINKNIINEYINSESISKKEKELIQKKYSNLLNFISKSEEINVEQIINKEYYNIKSNFHLSSSNNQEIENVTYNATIGSLNLSNY